MFPEIIEPIRSKFVSDAFKNIPITAIIIANKPINKTFPDSPSLYKTNTKEIKTNIVPGSGCNTIKIAGKSKNDNTLILVLKS